MKLTLVLFIEALTLLGWTVADGQEPGKQEQQSRAQTRVILLGTGTPIPDPDRSGPSTAVVVGDSAYLVDFGPGVVRRAEAALLQRGITALEPGNLKVAFVRHLHSDHTAGYSDLIFTGWTSGRSTPLEVYGPTGLKVMTEHILEAYRIDIETRTNPEGNQRAISNGWKVNAHEIKPGIIYKDANVTVTAFPTKHAMESYGYRFETSDRRIVISGDTSPTEETINACSGCDILVHDTQTFLFVREDARTPSFICDEIPHNDCAACGTCKQGQTQTPSYVPHHSVPSGYCPAKIPVVDNGYGCVPLYRRNTPGRDRLPIFGTVRHRA